MKMTCTRRDLHALKAVTTRLVSSKRANPIIQFANGAAGLVTWCVTANGYWVYSPSGDEVDGPRSEVVAIPLADLQDAAAKRNDLVEIEASTLGEVTIRWTEKGVPQVHCVERQEPVPMPIAPDAWIDTDIRLLEALQMASTTAAPEASRYRLDCLQLGQAGRVVGTDGKQLFIESGFRFPWTEDLLVPASKVWGVSEFRTTRSVRIGQTETVIEIAPEDWRIGLPVQTEGRFPEIDRIVPPQDPTSRFDLDEVDAVFLRDRLDCLASEAIAVEATPEGVRIWPIRTTEAQLEANVVLELGQSRSTADRLRFITDRAILDRALSSGCRQFFVSPDKQPLTGTAGPRVFVWMALPMDWTEPSADAVLITSAGVESKGHRKSRSVLVA